MKTDYLETLLAILLGVALTSMTLAFCGICVRFLMELFQ